MRIRVAFFLILVFLSSSTEFRQILKLPTLFHHYKEHVQSDNSTLLEFLKEHYINKINHSDDEHHDHENLPFKSLDCNSLQILNFSPPSLFFIFFNFSPKLKTSHKIWYEEYYLNVYLETIWQPPRF